jgi:hypothetical protein
VSAQPLGKRIQWPFLATQSQSWSKPCVQGYRLADWSAFGPLLPCGWGWGRGTDLLHFMCENGWGLQKKGSRKRVLTGGPFHCCTSSLGGGSFSIDHSSSRCGNGILETGRRGKGWVT